MKTTKNSINEQYPHIAKWVETHGWIEIGQQYHCGFIVALDEALAKWFKENE